ncbi:hypothetical protein B0T20DRAFT_478705 [Sordaria brevicollis]|uniref:Uncharacterized protein n=1 Tax=Sordaria brevicollis TaxID=83679 RepID=A0AAE0PH10_SORBR|nr:hypothetical protein B0T20DRAFT_478705 [Sordaria brevicollis]
MLSQSSNGRCPQGQDANGEPARKRVKREDDPSDEELSSSDETPSPNEEPSDEESSSSEDASEDAADDGSDEEDNDAAGDEEDGVNFELVGQLVHQILNPPPDHPAASPPPPEIHFDKNEVEAITDRVLDALDPDDMATSILIIVTMLEEAAGGHAPMLGILVGHVLAVLERMQNPEEYGVRNPAPPYSVLPRAEEVTMELAARLPEYINHTPRYTREPMPPPKEDSQETRGQQRKREHNNDDGEDGTEDIKENDAEEKNEQEAQAEMKDFKRSLEEGEGK